MATPTILFKRGNTASNDAYVGPLGSITIDTQTRKIRIHDGVTTGGYTVANMDDVQAVVDQVNALAIADIAGLQTALDALDSDILALDGRLDTVELNYIKKDGSVAFTGPIDAGTNKLINLSAPTLDTDGSTKKYVDDSISALGSVFDYRGTIDGGATEPTAFDLSTLTYTDAGSYYRVTTAGYFTYNAVVEYLNVKDGLIFNSTGGYDKIDNTNSEVQGTTDRVAVTGSSDSGFVVDIDTVFSDRVDNLETEVNAIETGAGLNSNGTYTANAVANYINAATSLKDADNTLDTELKSLADSVAGLNTGVSSISGTAPITVNNTDPVNPVVEATLASEAEAITGTNTTNIVTPQRTRDFVEQGEYTIDCGTF